jgi:hypothetical protein
MSVKTHTFSGKRYHVYIGQLCGLTIPGGKMERELLVRSEGLTERQLLGAIIHEAIHACDPDMPEKKVNQMGKDIQRLLWRLEYRSTKL